MAKSQQYGEFNRVNPSGVCRMGDTDVTFYRMNGNRLWFDKKAIEKVLTGKNQHNILGQDKDARNHGRIFDEEQKKVIYVISKTGVYNYLKKAWSVKDENRHYFYDGVKEIENPQEKKLTEPLQIPFFNAEIDVKVNNFVKISEANGQYFIDFTASGRNPEEKKHNLAKMLIAAANAVMVGNSCAKLKEIA